MHFIFYFLVVFLVSLEVSCQATYKNNNSIETLQTPQERVLGTWVMESSPSDKIVFNSNGELKKYVDNTLEYTNTYSITNSCNKTSSNDLLYLKQIDSEDGDVYCTLIADGIYSYNSNSLTLITEEQGKIIIYVRP